MSSIWRWVIGTVVGLAVLLLVALYSFSFRLTPIVKARAIEMLSSRFDSEVEMGNLQVRILHDISVEGGNLVLRHHGRTDVPPLIVIQKFSGRMAWWSLLGKPWHIRRVEIYGLAIHVPPKEERPSDFNLRRKLRDIPVILDELVAKDGELDLLPDKPTKTVHQFLIHDLRMHSVGLGNAAPFRASLTNAVPPGEITTEGRFGPWRGDDPGQTPLAANYVFDNADLGVFHGISGVLSSRGKFAGVLENIEVQGETSTPKFTVSVGGYPVDLETDFQATVDGTNGDTLLHPVIAQFLNTTLVCNGGVVEAPEAGGREIVLDVTTDYARLEDLLRLAVKSERPLMTGAVRLTTKFDLPPGKTDIADRLRLDGKFGISGAQFTSSEIREKLESLSRRGQGKPNDEDAGSAVSELKGIFQLRDGRISFRDLTFAVTGASVHLAGTYGLQNEQLDFHGTLQLNAKLSQSTTGVKSFFLKAFDPFFRKNGVTELPIKITGTRDHPSFGLELLGDKEEPQRESAQK